ncbi:MAG: DUF5610 domain-containing protein [Pseudomonadota bacterium]|nr:DUF5610 domain-containing protein [Pseudomonadota bacterium]
MHACNPLLKHNFSGADFGLPGRRHGWGQQRAMQQQTAQQQTVQQGMAVTGSLQIERTLAVAYERLQFKATAGVASAPSSTAPVSTPSSTPSTTPSTTSTATPGNVPAATDFSPQAVADRVLGFIRERLESERANGASEEEIQALYQQAVKGVEQGLREAKGIIQEQGLFSGSVKDNFYATVTGLADGLEALGEELFGVDLETAAETAVPIPETAVAAPATSAPGLGYRSTEVAFQRDRSFDLEVITQDGDKVTLHVSSGQSGYANQYRLASEGALVESLEAGYTQYDNVAFSVEGELDEGELSALRDLFAQVNSVAETFYAGDVEMAFDQAMNVGMDSEELAAFAVDIQQSQAVAVRDTYVAIDNMMGAPRQNGFADVLPRLGGFAKQVEQAGQQAQGLDSGRLEAPQLLRELIARLHSDADTGQGYGAGFRRFIEALA